MSDAVEYRDIPGFPGYRVGNDGTVWTNHYPGPLKGKSSRQPVLPYRWKRMRGGPHSDGYPIVTIRRDGRKFTRCVHQLVMLAFVGPYPVGMEVAHENGVRTDCRLSNLSYKTPTANQMDRHRHGTASIGERNPAAKLTTDAILAMRWERVVQGTSYEKLGRKYGVSKKCAMLVISGQRWGHVNG